MRPVSMVRVVPLLLLTAACANAGGSSPPVDSRGVDAPQILIDAPQVLIDAPVLVDARDIDAAVPVDAPPGSNLFCTTNAQCTIAGECCLKIDSDAPGFCVEGTVIIGTCLPIN
jgi:hypothetical protein